MSTVSPNVHAHLKDIPSQASIFLTKQIPFPMFFLHNQKHLFPNCLPSPYSTTATALLLLWVLRVLDAGIALTDTRRMLYGFASANNSTRCVQFNRFAGVYAVHAYRVGPTSFV
jgi:hypothetical protein